MDILQREIIDLGQECYIMFASVDEPHIYLRAKGKVLNRWIQGDNIGYYIHILEVLEDREVITKFLHRSKHRTFVISSERGLIKTIDCFDLTLNMETFNARFKERHKNLTWYLPAVFVFPTREQMEQKLTTASEFLKDRLKTSLDNLENRLRRLE